MARDGAEWLGGTTALLTTLAYSFGPVRSSHYNRANPRLAALYTIAFPLLAGRLADVQPRHGIAADDFSGRRGDADSLPPGRKDLREEMRPVRRDGYLAGVGA